MALDITSYALGKKTGGGSQPINLQDKEITIIENGEQTITADSGYDGLNSVEVTTNVSGGVPTQDWSDTGYNNNNPEWVGDELDRIDSIYDNLDEVHAYTKSIYDNWDAESTTGPIGNANTLVICPNIDVSNISDYRFLFSGYTKLVEVPALEVVVKSTDTNTKKLENMFYNCKALKYLDVSNFDTSNATSLKGIFYNCGELTEIDLSNFDTKNVTDISNMFYGCRTLTEIDLSNLNLENVTIVSGMLNICVNLERILFPNNFGKKIFQFQSFLTGTKIKDLDISNWYIGSATGGMTNFINNNSSLETITLGNNFNPHITSTYRMFYNNAKLKTITFGSFTFTGIGNLMEIFAGCPKLDDNTLNEILRLCTTATSFTGTKTLDYLGIKSTYDNYANIPNLSNYQDFLDAGWTIS